MPSDQNDSYVAFILMRFSIIIAVLNMTTFSPGITLLKNFG